MLTEMACKIVSCNAKAVKIQYEGAVYHVKTLGDRCENIFWDDEEREVLPSGIESGLFENRLARSRVGSHG